MTGQDHIDILLLMEDVEDLEHDASRQRKDGIDPFTFQSFKEDFCARELHHNYRSRVKSLCSPRQLDRPRLDSRWYEAPGSLAMTVQKVENTSILRVWTARNDRDTSPTDAPPASHR